MNTHTTLLMSGGIGDFLHYIVRFSSFLEHHSLAPEQVTVFVESTRPKQVESLFEACLPGVNCHFVPPMLHWTKTNPLLNVDRPRDRLDRPASQYVLRCGAELVEDWFLPFLCSRYSARSDRIQFLRHHNSASPSIVFVSVRDKGFLWWPTQEAFSLLEELIPSKYQVVYAGTSNERLPRLERFTEAPSVLEALKLSCGAALFVGTDTGFATARELLGLPNIYCINEYWFEELMVKYGYWTEKMSKESRSRFAFDTADLQGAILSFFHPTIEAQHSSAAKNQGIQ